MWPLLTVWLSLCFSSWLWDWWISQPLWFTGWQHQLLSSLPPPTGHSHRGHTHPHPTNPGSPFPLSEFLMTKLASLNLRRDPFKLNLHNLPLQEVIMILFLWCSLLSTSCSWKPIPLSSLRVLPCRLKPREDRLALSPHLWTGKDPLSLSLSSSVTSVPY